MSAIFRLSLLTVVAALALTGCKSAGTTDGDMASPAVSAAPAEPVTVVKTMSGQQSNLAHGGVWLISSAQQLAGCSGNIQADLKDVDLDQHDLVLVGLGPQQTAGYWVRITAIQQVGDVLYVQGMANAPAADSDVAAAQTNPYCVAVIAKSGATSVREDLASVTDQNPPTE